MRLKPFNPDKELKKANHKYTKKQLITTLLVLVVMITIGTSYAIFSIQPEYHTFIKSQVGEFSTGDIKLSVLVEGESQSDFPAKGTGYAFEKVECENGSTGTWDADAWQLTLAAKGPDKCTVSFVEAMIFSEYIKSLYDVDNEGSNGLYFHDGQGTYINADQEAGDNSYRYSGANPNNFVCFGSNDEICPNDNLYRIIGVFDNKIKLIKFDYAQSNMLGIDGDYQGTTINNVSTYKGKNENYYFYYWNNQNYNLSYQNNGFYSSWEDSLFSMTNLNYNFINYLNKISNNWEKIIENHVWNAGGGPSTYLGYGKLSTAKNVYDYELGVNSSAKKWQAKIGLMYVSDYMYSASPKYWTYPGFTDANNPDINGNYGANYDYRAAVEDNWLFMGLYEWTISRVSNDNRTAFYIHNNGNVHSDYVNNYNAVRPVFYIIEEVQIFEGADGTEDNPYRIAI